MRCRSPWVRGRSNVSIVTDRVERVQARRWSQAPEPVGRFSRPEDESLRRMLAGWVSEYHGLVVAVAVRALREQDRALAEDIAQDVWLTVWQHLLGGHVVEHPRGLLVVMARRRVYAHYALARVRREESVDWSDEAAVERLASWVGAAA